MNFGFEIVEVIVGSRASVYTVLIEGREQTELDLFLTNVQKEIQEIEDAEERDRLKEAFDFIVNRLRSTIPSTGCQARYFEPDGRADDAVEKLKQNLLRLFCLRYGKLLVIVGNGGIKPPSIRRTQDKEDLDKAVKQLQYINKRLDEAQEANLFSFSEHGKITADSKKKFEAL